MENEIEIRHLINEAISNNLRLEQGKDINGKYIALVFDQWYIPGELGRKIYISDLKNCEES